MRILLNAATSFCRHSVSTVCLKPSSAGSGGGIYLLFGGFRGDGTGANTMSSLPDLPRWLPLRCACVRVPYRRSLQTRAACADAWVLNTDADQVSRPAFMCWLPLIFAPFSRTSLPSLRRRL